jgi:hypothetical protein
VSPTNVSAGQGLDSRHGVPFGPTSGPAVCRASGWQRWQLALILRPRAGPTGPCRPWASAPFVVLRQRPDVFSRARAGGSRPDLLAFRMNANRRHKCSWLPGLPAHPISPPRPATYPAPARQALRQTARAGDSGGGMGHLL